MDDGKCPENQNKIGKYLDWPYKGHICTLQVDKGKGWMETEDKDPDEVAAQAWYRADIRQIVELNESIAHSFESLVVLLVDRLPVSGTEHPEGAGLEGEEEDDVENAGDGHV